MSGTLSSRVFARFFIVLLLVLSCSSSSVVEEIYYYYISINIIIIIIESRRWCLWVSFSNALTDLASPETNPRTWASDTFYYHRTKGPNQFNFKTTF